MTNEILILGNESSVIYYNLNKQFSNLKKLIITGEEVVDSFQEKTLYNILKKIEELKNKKAIFFTNDITFNLGYNDDIGFKQY